MEDVSSIEPKQGEATSSRRPFPLRYLRPKLAATVGLWQLETRTATPVALLLVATLGRWPGALAMGTLMAVFSAVFLILLEGDSALDELRAWLRKRRFGRLLERAARRAHEGGALHKGAAVFGAVFLVAPFWRAVTFHVFDVKRLPAYAISVGGSIPQSLFWTGIVLGSLWDLALLPALRELWGLLAELGQAFGALF